LLLAASRAVLLGRGVAPAVPSPPPPPLILRARRGRTTSSSWAAVPLGAGGGLGGSAIFWALLRSLREAALDPDRLERPLISASHELLCSCPLEGFSRRDLYVLCVGVAIGLAAGPILDLIWLARRAWGRFVFALAAQIQREVLRNSFLRT